MISAVTVTHRSFRCLQRLRASIKATVSTGFQWIVVDNPSRPPRTETVAELDAIEAAGEALVIRNDENRFFTAATNAGIRKAGGEHLLLLNPDCELTAGWVDEILRVVARPRVGIVGTVLVNERGLVQHAGARGLGDHDHQGAAFKELDLPRAWKHDGWITGAFLLITREALDAAGGELNERMRHYYSDCALCGRVRAAGFEVWMCGHPVLHTGGGAAL